MCRGGSLMYIHFIRSWRLPVHSRHSPCPLSSLKGFTPEHLKVLYVCTRTAVVSSAWTAVAGRGSLIGIGSSNTLGLLWRSLVVTCLFVPRRNRKIYWGYVVQTSNGALVEWVWLIETIYFSLNQLGLAQCYVTSIVDDFKCRVTLTAMLWWLLMISDKHVWHISDKEIVYKDRRQ